MISKQKDRKNKQAERKVQKTQEGLKSQQKQKQKQEVEKKKERSLNPSIKQIPAEEKESMMKTENSKQNKQVELSLNSHTLVANNSNLTMLKTLESAQIEKNLSQFYQLSQYRNEKFAIQPLIVNIKNDKQNKTQIIYTTENMKGYKQVFINIPTQFIHQWLIEIFYSLHPCVLKYENCPYFQINQSNLYALDSPFLPQIYARNEKLNWENPFKVLIKNEVKDEKQFFTQLHTFGQQFSNINQFYDLQNKYFEKKIKKFSKQIFSITNLASKIQNQIICSQLAQKAQITQKKQIEPGPLTSQIVKWVGLQASINSNLNCYLHFKASSCSFEPKKFWQIANSLGKDDSQHQLLVIEIQSGKSNILLGFYSTLLTQNQQISKQPMFKYISDTNKKSILFNISLRTVHHLVELEHAFGLSNQILLCIGKCDVILSAYNITNLCYFPVSYAPDGDQISSKAQALCGGKKFKLKQLYLYRFMK